MTTSSCRCSISDLLRLSIDLIDPPSRLPAQAQDDHDVVIDVDDDISMASPAFTVPVAHAAAGDVDVRTDAKSIEEKVVPHHHPSQHPPSDEALVDKSIVKKKVRFSKSCLPPRKHISAGDAVQAYKLLMHAAAIESASSRLPVSNGNDTINCNDAILTTNGIISSSDVSWGTLNDIADIFRALVVTSCLLLELLPTNHVTSTSLFANENYAPNNDNEPIILRDQSTILQHHSCCPLQIINGRQGSFFIPTLSPSIEKELLSTSLRCIRQLQYIERICAVKTISERHRDTLTTTTNPTTATTTAACWVSLYKGGDDIHDYERPIPDLYSNFDWHDDGFLPLPFSHTTDKNKNTNSDNEKEVVMSSMIPNNDNNSTKSQSSPDQHTSSNHNTTSNILYECCYLPRYPTDPPSSRYEKCAWTRDWIRGERLVSLRMEDYEYCDANEYYSPPDYDVRDFDGCGADHEGRDPTNAANTSIIHNHATVIIPGDADIHDRDDDDDGNFDAESVSLDISPAVLADEELCLLDVMLAGEESSSSPSRSLRCHSPDGHAPTKKRASTVHEKRKKKRLKLRQKKELEKQDRVIVPFDHSLPSQFLRGKEGFLLLVREEMEANAIFHHLFSGRKNTPPNKTTPKGIRVFVRLHPSGWLSIEDRSIRRYEDDNQESLQQQPLLPRVRYLDFYIGPETTCQPWVRNGTTSFHFRLHSIAYLGAFSLHQSSGDIEVSDVDNIHTIESVNLLLGVDEETGGDFADGFEWVNCISNPGK